MRFIDTHTHLNFEAFKNDVDEVIKRALKEDLSKIIVVGTNLETSQRAVELAEQNPNVYATIGIHPYHALGAPEGFREELEILAKSEKVVAIGEIGLDFYRIKDHQEKTILQTKDKQLEVLRAQLGVAIRLDLPVIIHNRKADEDLIGEVQRYKETKRMRGVFHCFDSPWDLARRVLENNFYISFTGIITYPNKVYLQEVIKNVPDDKYLLETDSPYLPPKPTKNERNEPKDVKIIAEKIAKIRKITLEEVARETSRNAKKLFEI